MGKWLLFAVIVSSPLWAAEPPTPAQKAACQEDALKFCQRNRTEFTHYFAKRVRGMQMPHVEFVIDLGDKNRRRLDELTK